MRTGSPDGPNQPEMAGPMTRPPKPIKFAPAMIGLNASSSLHRRYLAFLPKK
jgi:hypothetical protein